MVLWFSSTGSRVESDDVEIYFKGCTTCSLIACKMLRGPYSSDVEQNEPILASVNYDRSESKKKFIAEISQTKKQ